MEQLTSLTANARFLTGGGEMGKLIRLKQWDKTLLGEPHNWPQSLKTTIGIILSSKFPMFLWWGPQLICLYNDAYIPCLGEGGKHPHILGMPAKLAWAEIWSIIKPMIDRVIDHRETLWREDQLIPIFRNNKIEDVYWTFSYSPVTDESGEVAGVLVMCSDTTEKINAVSTYSASKQFQKREASVEKEGQKYFINSFNASERKFRNAVMQAPVGITVLRGSEFFVEMANQAYLEIVNRPEKDFVGRPIFDSIPETRNAVEALLVKVFETGIPFNTVEHPIPLNKFGTIEIRYFNFSYNVLRDDTELINGIIVIVNDVTDMVKAKLSMIAYEKHFRNMVMQSPVPMVIFRGIDPVIEMANSAMLNNIWTRAEQDVIGKSAFDVFPELSTQVFSDIFYRVYKTGESYKAMESVAFIEGKDGTKKFYLDNEYTPLFEADGQVSGIMMTVNNVTEKVNSRQALEEAETRLRLATEGTKLATWDLDLATMEIVHSPRLAEIFGFSPDTKLTHAYIRSLLEPNDLKNIVEVAFEKAMVTSEYDYVARLHWPDKSLHWIKTQGKVFYNEKKQPFRLIGTMMDITDNKLNEIEMGKLAAIVLTSEDAIISKNLQGNITSWNSAATRMFGYQAAEVIGKSVYILIPPSRVDEEVSILTQIKRGQLVSSFQTKRLTKDGKVLDISLTISPIKNAAGEIVGASKIARDITGQKEIENRLIESESKFRLLANSMAQLVWTGDVEGNLNYFNQAVYDYSGFNYEDLQKEGWLQIVHPDDREENIIKWNQAISTGEYFIVEHRFKRSDGQYRWQLSRAIPQRDVNGNIQMWVGTSTDIHEIKENEQQKDFFISMASHELKTPITSIKGYVQILMSMYKVDKDEFLHSSLKTINKQIITLTALITDLLDLSKIKSGSLQLSKEKFCINPLVKEIIKEVQLTQPDCVIDFAGDADAIVNADRDRIGQVLINLLTNAIKYSPFNKNIYVNSKLVENKIEVTVTDSGIGINKTDQQKIFQRFYRVSGKDEKTFPGFGIGLFIASEIINRHEGFIGVESEPGKGSVFYFSLPILKENSDECK